jgi:hypothetical protein
MEIENNRHKAMNAVYNMKLRWFAQHEELFINKTILYYEEN